MEESFNFLKILKSSKTQFYLEWNSLSNANKSIFKIKIIFVNKTKKDPVPI
jgi:hypothetical protein